MKKYGFSFNCTKKIIINTYIITIILNNISYIYPFLLFTCQNTKHKNSIL